MHYLGVPTTRALSLLSTGDEVLRDMFYDGNPQLEKGAIVARLSRSFIRFGNFELLAARGELETLKKLLIASFIAPIRGMVLAGSPGTAPHAAEALEPRGALVRLADAVEGAHAVRHGGERSGFASRPRPAWLARATRSGARDVASRRSRCCPRGIGRSCRHQWPVSP